MRLHFFQFSGKESIFYLLFMGSALFHRSHMLLHNPQYLFLKITGIAVFIFCKRMREIVVFLFLAHAVVTGTIGFPSFARGINLFTFTAFFLLLDFVFRIRYPDRKRNIWGSLGWFLVIFYFFAGFHKLNSNFIDAAGGSCAGWFLAKVAPVFGLQNLSGSFFLKKSFVWGCLFLELGTAFLLVFSRTRAAGLILALCLHLFLCLAGFVKFSSLCLALMVPFLSETAFTCKKKEKVITFWGFASIAQIPLFAGFIYLLGVPPLIAVVAWRFYFIISVALVLFFLISGREGAPLIRRGGTVRGIGKRGFFFVVFFFFWGGQNYLGLGTLGNFSMYSNIKTEGEKGNHLLLGHNKLKLFSFQDDIVWVERVYPPRLDRFYRRGPLAGRGLPLVEFKRKLFSKRNYPRYHRVGMDFVYRKKEYSVDRIVLDKRWSPQTYDWPMKLLYFRLVPPESPGFCQL